MIVEVLKHNLLPESKGGEIPGDIIAVDLPDGHNHTTHQPNAGSAREVSGIGYPSLGMGQLSRSPALKTAISHNLQLMSICGTQ